MSKSVTVKNPAAGRGGAMNVNIDSDSEYITNAIGDATEYAYELCRQDPYAHITVCGGDGTVNEVVNGIMKAGTGKTSSLSVVPAGTGNDFVKSLEKGEFKCDVGKYGDKYFINVLNIGFDCDVVAEVVKMKKHSWPKGSFAYILGVIKCLFKKHGVKLSVLIEDENGNIETHSGEYMILVAGNASYYGGGFCAAPAAKLNDGLLDIVLVKKISLLKFITVIGDYKSGKHVDPATNKPKEKFSSFMLYKQCKRIVVENMERICVDGEIEPCNKTEISVVKEALNIIY